MNWFERTLTTGVLLAVFIVNIFIVAGCRSMYEKMGFTEQQISEQMDEDKDLLIRTITETRSIFGDIVLSVLAGLGALLSGWLGIKLNTANKTSVVLADAIKTNTNGETKAAVINKAASAGVGTKVTKLLA